MTTHTAEIPSFLVVGAAKSGTTALFTQLAQHPSICFPRVKETNFFALEGHELDFRGPGDIEALTRSEAVATVTRWGDYVEMFAQCPDQSTLGEVCPLYLYSPEAPQRIRHYLPQVRLIAVLRHPVDRAFSAYRMLLMAGRETETSFLRALDLESQRIRDNWESAWHYLTMGQYSAQLRRYLSHFPRHQIRLYLYDEFSEQPQKVLDDICTFLGLEHFSADVSARPGMTGVPRNQWLQRVLTRPNRLRTVSRTVMPASWRRRAGSTLARWNRKTPHLDPDTRKQLTDSLTEEILDLGRLINRDLSHWLGHETA